MKYLVILTSVLSFLIIGCDSTDSIISEDNNDKIHQPLPGDPLETFANPANYRNLEGQFHNDGLQAIYDYNNVSPGTVLTESQIIDGLADYIYDNEYYNSSSYSTLQEIKDNLEDLYDNLNDESISQYSSRLNLSSNQESYIDDLNDMVNYYFGSNITTSNEQDLSGNFSLLSATITNIENQILNDNQLSSKEEKELLSFAAIMKYSAYFWTSYYDSIYEYNPKSNSTLGFWSELWEDIKTNVKQDAHGFFDGVAAADESLTIEEKADPSSGSGGYVLGEGVKSGIEASAK